MLRLLIADDHPVIRQGIIHLLRSEPGFDRPAEAATRAETLAQVTAHQPDLLIMNTTLVDADSLEMVVAVKRLQPALRIVLLHPEPEPDFTRRALACGADGIVTKLEPDEELLAALHAVARGEISISAATAKLMNG